MAHHRRAEFCGCCDLVHAMIVCGLMTLFFGLFEIGVVVMTAIPTVFKIGIGICGLLDIPIGFFAAYGSWHRTSYLLRPFLALSKAKMVFFIIAIIFTLCSHITYETAIDNFQLWDRRTHPENEERKARIALGIFTAGFLVLLLWAIFLFVLSKKCYRYLKAEEHAAKHHPAPANPNDRLTARMQDRHVTKSNYF